MKKIIKIKPRTKALIIGMLLLNTFFIVLGFYKGLGSKTVYIVIFMTLLEFLDAIYISNHIVFYNDKIKIKNMITKKIKTFQYESISKIKFDTNKSVSFIKIKFKNGKSIKIHSNCGYGNMQEAEEKFWDAFPHLS